MFTFGLARLVLLCVAPPTLAKAAYFGFFHTDLADLKSTINLQFELPPGPELNAASEAGVQSLLPVRGYFFGTAPSRQGLALLPDWEARWSAALPLVKTLLSNGTIFGVFMGDELVWGCLPMNNLTFAIAAVRASLPRGADGTGPVIWSNEAAMIDHAHTFCNRTEIFPYVIAPGLDWFSVDIYHMDGYVAGWVDKCVQGLPAISARLPDDGGHFLHRYVRGYYEKWIFPNLTKGQSAALVPGGFGSNVNHYPNGTYVCNRSCYDAMGVADAHDFFDWASTDSRVAALAVWNWKGCPTCNGSRWTPPHTCCMDEIGVRDMPGQRAAWARIGRRIIGPGAEHGADPRPIAEVPCEPAASDARLLQLRASLCGSLAQADPACCGASCPNSTHRPKGDWPNQAVYLHELLAALASPSTCLTTPFARQTLGWLNSTMSDPTLSSSFMWTWDVFQVQYYDMPRLPGTRIEAPDTLGRKCWAFAYLSQLWSPGSLTRALAAAGLPAASLANFSSRYEASIALSMPLCDRVIANCFVNASYDPARNGTCPLQVLAFKDLGFERENLLRGGIVQYPFTRPTAERKQLASGQSNGVRWRTEPAAPAEGKPNFLVLFVDDMGINQVSVATPGLYGYSGDGGTISTPNIAKLAADGMTFQSWCAQPPNSLP